MRAALAIAAAALAAASVSLSAVERVRPGRTGSEGTRYLELAKRARPALLGYEAVAADLVWLQAIQYLGQRLGERRDLEGLYDFLDAVTELDPKYQAVYYLGGTSLVALDRRPDEALRLLEKGASALPGDWQIPYLMGYTYLFYYQDYETAARYIETAARNLGRPTYLTRLAARLYAQAGSAEVALEFLESMRRQAQDPAVRAGIEERMREVVVDRDLKTLDAAAVRFRQARGHWPETPEAMARAGLLAFVPAEPFGGRYVIDPATGRAASSSGHGRLAVYRSKKRWGGVEPR